MRLKEMEKLIFGFFISAIIILLIKYENMKIEKEKLNKKETKEIHELGDRIHDILLEGRCFFHSPISDKLSSDEFAWLQKEHREFDNTLGWFRELIKDNKSISEFTYKKIEKDLESFYKTQKKYLAKYK
jgi:hypothetical protein